MSGNKPLEGIKVLDFTSFVSGTTCTQQLAWLGADVIKVERPLPKDAGNAKPKASVRFDYQMLNMNKKSITCNAKTPEGLELLKKLVKECDVLVENMNPGAIQRMGLDYETCKAINPGIIFTQIKGFAEDGPFGKYPAFNSVAVAMGGFASGLGMPDGEPIVNGPADQISGIYAAYGILAAILQRNKTGLGQKVFISMQEVMMFLSFQNFLQYANNGKVPERSGNLMAGVKTAPHNIYRCAPCGENDYVQIYCSRHPGATEFEELCRVIGREDIIGTEKFKTPESRFENREELDAIIEGWTSKYSKYEVMEKMALAGVPCGAVLDVADLAGDEYLRESGAMIGVGEGSEKAYQPGFTPRMSEFKPDYKNAPHVGDSNHEVYGEILGLSEEEMADLKSKGVI